ncbi:hypothetical protein [Adonisia turfae]|uniref:hypothetical protein n=1 Tax=Adonisia turfae TaxID=2950184 RepID=UPI0013D7BDF0|nr:hypothetical protein [Adonisia turfae]
MTLPEGQAVSVMTSAEPWRAPGMILFRHYQVEAGCRPEQSMTLILRLRYDLKVIQGQTG